MHAPGPDLNEEQHVGRLEKRCLDREEVTGHDACSLRLEELAPDQAAARCGADPVTAKQHGDGTSRDTDTEVLQLTFDPQVAPARVLLGQAQNQSPDLAIDGPGAPAAAAGVSTSHYESLVPAQQRLGTNEERAASSFVAGCGWLQPEARGPGAYIQGASLGGEGSPPGGAARDSQAGPARRRNPWRRRCRAGDKAPGRGARRTRSRFCHVRLVRR